MAVAILWMFEWSIAPIQLLSSITSEKLAFSCRHPFNPQTKQRSRTETVLWDVSIVVQSYYVQLFYGSQMTILFSFDCPLKVKKHGNTPLLEQPCQQILCTRPNALSILASGLDEAPWMLSSIQQQCACIDRHRSEVRLDTHGRLG